MTILVTGAAGFIGRAVVQTLLNNYADDVVAIDQTADPFTSSDRLTYYRCDLSEGDAIARVFNQPVDKIIHLAAVPGGQSEADPQLSAKVNLNLPLALMNAAAAQSHNTRFVNSSSIAVFGDDLPSTGLDDDVPASPHMVYGMHKAMMEIAVGTKSRRGEIEGISLRLPGIVARPPGSSGLKSAFLSEIFYALVGRVPYTVPVSAQATSWILSSQKCAENICHAAHMDLGDLRADRVVNVPAERVSMERLIGEIASELSVSADLVSYLPDPDLQAAFGSYPPLSTPMAQRLGIESDGSIPVLVRTVLSQIQEMVH